MPPQQLGGYAPEFVLQYKFIAVQTVSTGAKSKASALYWLPITDGVRATESQVELPGAVKDELATEVQSLAAREGSLGDRFHLGKGLITHRDGVETDV